MFAEVVNGSYVLLVGNLLHHFESTDITNTVANSLICNTAISFAVPTWVSSHVPSCSLILQVDFT
jgi:hypothetical protein